MDMLKLVELLCCVMLTAMNRVHCALQLLICAALSASINSIYFV